MTADSAMPGFSSVPASRFVAATGLVIEEVSPHHLRGTAQLGADHHTPWGVVHGGVFTSLVESAASVAASHAVAENGQYAVGVNNSTDFLRPAVTAHVTVEAHALHQGRTQQLWLVVISDSETQKVFARGQLRLQNVPLPSEGTAATNAHNVDAEN